MNKIKDSKKFAKFVKRFTPEEQDAGLKVHGFGQILTVKANTGIWARYFNA